MKIKFWKFITESKNYPIYKGVDDMYKILKSGVIKTTGDWEGIIRKNNINVDNGISVTRNFYFAAYYGSIIIEFDTQKLSDNYKIIPFSENPDFYIWYQGDKGFFKSNIEGTPPKNPDLDIAKALRNKKYTKQYWDYKTNKDASDFDISEELIVAKQIPIKYIKKVYIMNKYENDVIELLEEMNIPYEIKEDRIMSTKYKNKNIKTYSQI